VTQLIEEGLKKYPTSGELWAMSIEQEPLAKRKAKSYTALEKCDNNIHVINTISRIFMLQKMHEKASAWMERSLLIEPKFGDTWA